MLGGLAPKFPPPRATSSFGAPTTMPPDGAFVVDVTNNVLYFGANGVWQVAGLTLPISDATPLLENGSDTTKLLRLDLTNLTTGTTRTWTVADIDFTVIGYDSSSVIDAPNQFSMGPGSHGTVGTNSYAFGRDAQATGNSAVAIGYLATASGTFTLAFGQQASASGTASFAVGFACNASNGGVAFGFAATASGSNSLAIGTSGSATGTFSIAIGDTATASANGEIAISTLNQPWALHPQTIDSSGSVMNMAEIGSAWADNTHLTRKGRLTLGAYYVTTVWEGIRIEGSQNAANVSFFGAGSWGGGEGTMFITNATTNPSSNPTGGGILYADSGALKYRGSGGTTTTLGPAEPHCPTCGSDFVSEFDSDQYGYLCVCLKCLADELGERPWILRRKAA